MNATPNQLIRAALDAIGVTSTDEVAVAYPGDIAAALVPAFADECDCCGLPRFATADIDEVATAAVLATVAHRRASLSGCAAVLDATFTRDDIVALAVAR